MKFTEWQAALGPALYLVFSVLAGMVGMAVIGGLAAVSVFADEEDRALDTGRHGYVHVVQVAPDQAGRG